MSGTAPKLCNELLRIHLEEYYDLSVVERSKMGPKYSPTNLALEDHNYNEKFTDIPDY